MREPVPSAFKAPYGGESGILVCGIPARGHFQKEVGLNVKGYHQGDREGDEHRSCPCQEFFRLLLHLSSFEAPLGPPLVPARNAMRDLVFDQILDALELMVFFEVLL